MTSLSLRTALVVETNYLVASVIEAPLSAAGYHVDIAVTSDEANEVMATKSVHLAVIDFRLQHGHPDGLVARLIDKGIPFVFCTAATVDEVNEHFPEARVISKPFSDEDLLRVVGQLAPVLAADLELGLDPHR